MWKPISFLASVALAAAALLGGSGSSGAAEKIQQPMRVYQGAIPAQIAFTHQKQLWMVNASDPQAAPRQVTSSGDVQIAGWSADGAWLFYLHAPSTEEAGSNMHLWAVKADGTGAFQVDPRPVRNTPKWAPSGHRFAYLAEPAAAEEGAGGRAAELVVAELAPGKVTKLLEQKREVEDMAWMPDGDRLLISVPAAKGRPITLEVIDLAGNRQASDALGEPPKVEEGIYPYAARGLSPSPDGKRVSYFVIMSSASLTADGVPIQLFDLTQPRNKPIAIGEGLAYPEWIAWAKDSSRFAFINGTGRVATENKQLGIAQVDGRVVSAGIPGMADAFPRWSGGGAETLYFTRGPENAEWLGNYRPGKPLMPGQRIWKYGPNGQMQAVTQGPEETADTYPAPSPDGSELLFVRLDGAEHGSVYLLAADGRETELIRHVTGTPGYYANYLPAWISVYWLQPK